MADGDDDATGEAAAAEGKNDADAGEEVVSAGEAPGDAAADAGGGANGLVSVAPSSGCNCAITRSRPDRVSPPSGVGVVAVAATSLSCRCLISSSSSAACLLMAA